MNKTINALAMLKMDHQKVKGLFDQFEKAKEFRGKKKIAQEAIQELKVHAALEEEIFYPTVREEIEDSGIMNEAQEEHHVAKVLIAELDEKTGDNEVFEAKFTVLAENVRHHIKEEEGTLFPEVRKMEMDLDALGEKMAQRKEELMSAGVPETAESALVKGNRSNGQESLRKNARRGMKKEEGVSAESVGVGIEES